MNVIKDQVWRNKNNAKRLRVEFSGNSLVHVMNMETRKTALIDKKDLVAHFELEQ